MNAKTGILAFGALLGALSASALGPLPVTTDLTARFDASDATSMTLSEHGEVLEWRSQVGSVKLTAPAPMRADNYNYCNGIPFLTTENNLKAVFFGETWDGISTNSLMSTSIGSIKTVVAVTRQHSESDMIGALFGQVISSAPRLKRAANCTWDNAEWVNGVKGQTSFAECGGTSAPHVAVVTFSTNTKSIEIVGAAYNARSSGASGPVASSYDPASVHELLFYKRVLTDDELTQVQQYLMEKWCVDGLYVWTGAKDQNWNDGANWVCGRVPGDDAKTIRLDGAAVVAQGALSLPATALIDLAGGSLAVAGLTGGVVTNSAQTVATLTVNAATDAELDAKVSGNVNLVKNGSGVLKVAPGQTYAGTTTLNGGTFKALQPETDVLSKYTDAKYKMVLHLDASDASTITTEAGTSNVTKWASLTENGYSFRPLKDAYSAGTYDFAKGDSLLTTDADGRPCVRFGSQINDATSLGSALCPFDNTDAYESLSIATVFFVNRQHVAAIKSGQCGLFGQTASADRIYRGAGDCVWTNSNIYTLWTSGKKQYDLSDNPQLKGPIEFASCSGTAGPHVLSIIRCSNDGTTPEGRSLRVIGAAYLSKSNPTAASLCGQFDLYEAVGFNSVLTEAEIKEITDHLIAKWGVKTREDVVVDRPENTLSTNTSYVVTAPTVLDLGWMNQDFGNLSFATESTSYPLLTFVRALSSVGIDGKTLTLSHSADISVKKSDILCGNAGISGEFAEVMGGKVWYAGEEKERRVRAGDKQGMLILLK